MAEPDFVIRTRAAYDTITEPYTEWVAAELAVRPLDRAVLGGFAELVTAADAGPVVEIGCGPGRITAHLHGLGLAVFGIDLSPRMVARARQDHPHLRFAEGSMLGLDLDDSSLGGLVAWYSIIHVPDERLPDVFAEFHRVLAPGGYTQLAFAVGDEVVPRDELGGHPVSLDFHPRRPDRVADLLRAAGLHPRARLVREPDTDGDYPEWAPQAFLLVRKPLPTDQENPG
ncbi:class I SAM-dependent DNA methyltransferase [Saccharomonospora halophila]|uniref:class I SAM-dependent DNA methyltransferase n=1 Tax=Saccharomonospora halophila TaxID=129922 RepID=UPI00035D2B02|nr:class I SAM-dependent methyltransferase [Saccharomonospora halophila]